MIDNIVVLISQMRNLRYRGVKYITCASSFIEEVLELGIEFNLQTRALILSYCRIAYSPAINTLTCTFAMIIFLTSKYIEKFIIA